MCHVKVILLHELDLTHKMKSIYIITCTKNKRQYI